VVGERRTTGKVVTRTEERINPTGRKREQKVRERVKVVAKTQHRKSRPVNQRKKQGAEEWPAKRRKKSWRTENDKRGRKRQTCLVGNINRTAQQTETQKGQNTGGGMTSKFEEK
jgi:hypothetical protein